MMTDTPEAPKKEAKAKRAKRPTLSVVEKTGLQTLLERMNEEYSVILRGSQVLIMRHWIGQDGQSKLIFLNKRDFLLLQENNKLWVDDGQDGKKAIKIGPTWLEWPQRSGYEEVYFDPQGHEYSKRYNLWRGFAIKPTPCTDTAGFSILLDHIKTNICQGKEEYYIWIMSWLADLFQKPARKIGTALVLRGPMGIGKGAFAGHIGKLLGIHYMPITQSSQLTGKFNGHMADKVLMFVDEGWWNDERNGAGILRALITEPQVTIEMKGRDAVAITNFTRFIVAANADWVVPLGMGDERRFMMLDVGKGVQRDTVYFNSMEEQLTNIRINKNGKREIIDKALPENAGYQELLHYLLHYEYDESIPRNILQTQALMDNKIFSMPDEVKWWHECLIRKAIDDFRLEDGNNEILTDDFYKKYQLWCDGMKYKPIAFNVLPKKLKLFIEFNKKEGLNAKSERVQFYHLPSIKLLREKFEDYMGYQINWEDV